MSLEDGTLGEQMLTNGFYVRAGVYQRHRRLSAFSFLQATRKFMFMEENGERKREKKTAKQTNTTRSGVNAANVIQYENKNKPKINKNRRVRSTRSAHFPICGDDDGIYTSRVRCVCHRFEQTMK